MFTKKDEKQFAEKNLEIQVIEKQIHHFKTGFPYVNLVAPATKESGLHVFSEKQTAEYAAWFDEHFVDYEILKFVPASGAASRMFKTLFEFNERFNGSKSEIEYYLNDTGFNSPFYFMSNLKKFAFYDELNNRLTAEGYSITDMISNFEFHVLLDFFLTERGMDYANLPKGLLTFHSYEDSPRLAVEEHLVEAAHYATDKDNIARLHLTVSPEHQSKFEMAVAEKKTKYEKKFNVKYDISFSQQKGSTDTIAVDLENNPFRNADGSLLFRPGGHGALIENLDDLMGEIIFIKNIDNVVPDRLKGETYVYKKVIGGLLMKLQEKNFEFLEMLSDGNVSDQELENIRTFAKNELNIFIPAAYEGYDTMERIDFLYNKMNRPMRVCGMVKNEGEPGGGPFWVLNDSDELSLQIVESSQINLKDSKQLEIVNQSTHFNPVDLVCGVRDFEGNNFDLHEFIDPSTGFISQKSKDGKELKAQELPGLWNGAMADWITVFVEVPLITFNPVKTINDLLRSQHQPA